ncbi:MAG: hypothetical protein KJ799_03900 [Bacteroidetes bacterium]|nr:hypothetical protein [Bacteroidota bacterium]
MGALHRSFSFGEASKTVYVKNNKNKIPPKLHNFVRLAEFRNLTDSDDEKRIMLDKIYDFNIEGSDIDIAIGSDSFE